MIILDGDDGNFHIFHDGRERTWLLSDGPCCGCVVQNLMKMRRMDARLCQHL